MKLSTFVLPALCVFTGVQADVEKRCTIGLSVECWYNGFNAQNQQYRCAVPGQYAVAYAFGLCPSTYGGYNYVKGECITAGKYNGRHKCRYALSNIRNTPEKASCLTRR